VYTILTCCTCTEDMHAHCAQNKLRGRIFETGVNREAVVELELDHSSTFLTQSPAAFWIELQWFCERGQGPHEWWYSSHPPTSSASASLPFLASLSSFSCQPWPLHPLGRFLLFLLRRCLCLLPHTPLSPQRPAFAVASCAFFPGSGAALVASRPAAAASRRSTWGASVAAASAAAWSWTTQAILLRLRRPPLHCLQGRTPVLPHSLWTQSSTLWQ
jgi:hypothetical protein